LLSRKQTVFVLASHDFSEDEAAQLKAEFFGQVRARELKYSQLRGRARQQEMILAFLKFMREHQDRKKVFCQHKQFGMTCKIVDHVIETSMHRHGVNLYESGGNLAIANLIHFITVSLAGEDYYRLLLDAFQELIRKPTLQLLRNAEALLESKTGLRGTTVSSPERLKETLGFIHLALLDLDFADIGRFSGGILDACFSIALNLMAKWAEKHRNEMILIHDASSNMSRMRGLWDRIVAPGVTPEKVGWDRRTMEYPIRVKETKFEKSVDWAGIQLADVLAGAIGESLRVSIGMPGSASEYSRELQGVLGDWTLDNLIWPEPKFTPEELGTTGDFANDPIEHFMRFLVRR
jgi:hypothetical protein